MDRRRSRSHSTSPSSDPAKKNRSQDAGHFEWTEGLTIASRYKVTKLLGDGTFGRVLEVEDQQDQSIKALKVIRAVKRYISAAKIEAEILNRLGRADPENNSKIVKLYDAFPFEANFALVFEPMGPSLYDIIKRNDYKGFSHPGFTMYEVQQFARQILQAAEFMHRMRLTHTDLKPENILLQIDTLLEDPERIKIIDFGGATFAEDYHSSVINTRQYRAPEVILGQGYAGLQWREKSDIWSIGCILVELFTGELLFPTHDNYEHLAMMERVLGPLPSWMARHSSHSCRKYFDNHHLNFPKLASHRSERAVRKLPDLHVSLKQDLVPNEYRKFRHFILEVLEYDPDTRPRAKDLLAHSFFSETYPKPGQPLASSTQ